MKIKSILVFCPILLLAQAALSAAIIPCGVASLATYQSYGSTGCSLGPQFNFSSFSYVATLSVNTTVITATDITVTPQLSAGGPKFGFAANWGTSNSILPSSYTGVIGFHGASADPVFNAFNSLTLVTTGSTSSIASVANVNEIDCVGGLLNNTGTACLSGVGITSGASISGSNLSANTVVAFIPATTIDVLKTINLSSTGTAISPAFANLTNVQQDFGTNAPEPSTWLLTSSTIGFGIWLRRKRFLKRSARL